MRRSALIADGEVGDPNKALELLDRAGFEVEIAANGQAALGLLAQKRFTLALVDQTLEDFDGFQLLDRIKNLTPQTEVILITPSPDLSEAVEAIRRGAGDYMAKPVDTERLAARIACLKDSSCARADNHPGGGYGNDHDPVFITRNPEMQQLLDAAGRVAGTRATVLITGESGTGKEVLATHIHRAAGSSERPFVAVNCAALPETLIESELFGHEKGAFTGASQRKTGKFELVGEGTIVLDEIGDMPIGLQPKILRILQERRIERLGGSGSRSFEGQVIAITNQDLEAAVKSGQFREDLFYRINVVPFHLPPLRARQDDIPLLARHFISKYATLYDKPFKTVDAKILEAMGREPWRGNVRELENRIERAMLMSAGSHLDSNLLVNGHDVTPPPTDEALIKPGLSVRGMEKILICKTMQAVNHNRAKASELLGISVRTLRNKLNEYKDAQTNVNGEVRS